MVEKLSYKPHPNQSLGAKDKEIPPAEVKGYLHIGKTTTETKVGTQTERKTKTITTTNHCPTEPATTNGLRE